MKLSAEENGKYKALLLTNVIFTGSPLVIVGVSAFVRREGYGGPR